MASNSRLLPSSGLGATAEPLAVADNNPTPHSEAAKPTIAGRLISSPSQMRAITATNSGTSAAMVPAWAELVYCSAWVSHR